MHARRHPVLALVTVMGLTLTGCVSVTTAKDHAAPSAVREHTTGGVTPRVPGESSPPSGMPPTPADALAQTDAGARAFAAHYFTVETLAYARMDGMILNPLSAAECSPCYRTFYSIAEENTKGHRLTGFTRTFTARSVKHYPAEPETVSVIGQLDSTDATRVDRSGRTLNAVDVPAGRAAVSLTWQGGQWMVTNMQMLDG